MTGFRRRSSDSRAFLYIGLRMMVLALFVLVYHAVFMPYVRDYRIFALTLIPTCLSFWMGPLMLIRGDSQRTFYDPATLFNTGLFYYSLKGVGLSWGETTKFLSGVSDNAIAELYPMVVLATTIGIILWNYGYWFMLARAKKAQTQVVPRKRRGLPDMHLNPRLGVSLLILIGLISYVLLFVSIDEDPFVFLRSSWKRGYLADATVFGTGSRYANFFLSGIKMLPVASMVWLAISGSRKRGPGVGWWLYTLSTTLIVFSIFPRAFSLGSLISLLIIYHLLVKPIRIITLGAMGFVGVFYSYAIGVWRSITGATKLQSIQQGLATWLGTLELDGIFEFTMSGALADIRIFVLVAYYYGRELPLKYGDTLLRIFYQLIPRAFWPGKPYDLGVELGRLSNPYTFSGTPPGFIAEMYMNFHIWGVIIGSFLLGVLIAWLYYKLVLSSNRTPQSVVIYAILAQRLFLLPSNTLSLAILALVIPMGYALVAFKLCEFDSLYQLRRRQKRSLRTTPAKPVIADSRIAYGG